MLSRAVFVKTFMSVLAASAASPPAKNPWDLCDHNPTLPYDHPMQIQMQALDAPDFDLMKYRGYPVLLNIFATWCEPCTAEMPYLVAAANEYHAHGLRVVGMDHVEPDDTVRAYRKRFSIPYPIAMDRAGGFVRAIESGTRGGNIEFPVTLFVTPDGYLYCYRVGSMSQRELTYRIEKFLHDAPPAPRDAAAPSPTPSS